MMSASDDGAGGFSCVNGNDTLRGTGGTVIMIDDYVIKMSPCGALGRRRCSENMPPSPHLSTWCY